MTEHLFRPLAVAIGVLSFAACSNDTVAPGAPASALPEPALSAAVAAANSWTVRADMPTPRWSLAAGVANNSSGAVLYAIGGLSNDIASNRRSLNMVEAYSVPTNTWSARAPLPQPLHNTNGVGLIGGKLYVSGGQTLVPGAGTQGSKALYVYDPSRNTWSRKSDMPRPAARGVTGTINEKLYVVAGGGDTRLYRYDPATNTWNESLRPIPEPHTGAAAGVINGKLYVAGGQGAGTAPANRLHVYDPATNQWTTKAPMPIQMTDMAGVVIAAKLYLVGGINSSGTRVATVQVYNSLTNRWTTAASMPTARYRLAAGRILLNGEPRILAVGGSGEDPGSYTANELYTR